MTAYYNEIDPFCAQWLRNLIMVGLIADGVVDERSIVDVTPADLVGFTQCHFFAGIGVWSHALRAAGWSDDREVWTGSCPCQPFSAAGKGAGFADERHLWPAWYYLIGERRPRSIFGEQVASKDGLAWLDLVHTDLETACYATTAVDLCAAGVGAPHIRQRLFFVAESRDERRQGIGLHVQPGQSQFNLAEARRGGEARDLADAVHGGLPSRRAAEGQTGQAGAPAADSGELGDAGSAGAGRDAGAVPSAQGGARRSVRGVVDGAEHAGAASDGRLERGTESSERGAERGRGESFWADCEWLPCSDGKARPVEPGTFPLAHGIAGRVGRLRAYGNAIVAPLAKEFIAAAMECIP